MASPGAEPSAKRAKLAEAGAPSAFLRDGLMAPASRDELRQQIASSEPYTHGVLEALADRDFMVKVRDEIIHNIQATYKETDLFKVFQTGGRAYIPVVRPAARNHRGKMQPGRRAGAAAMRRRMATSRRSQGSSRPRTPRSSADHIAPSTARRIPWPC